MKCAGLIFDDSRHYLDHLGPFCALARCPLICCEPEIAELAARFYPDLEVREFSKLPKYTITCDTQPFLQAAFPGQSTKILWLPHGNSDKGWNSPFFDALKGETAFVYGQRMIDFMGEKGVFPKTVPIGNFRRQYFSKMIGKPEGKTFLYAPTWDESNSFWKAFPLLAKQLPADCNLWVKLHPNTIKKFAPEIEVLIGRYSQPNIEFLPDDPPIYPLLAKCSAYIGDMSSIGYDFLAFNRPMYFLNANPSLPLHGCGMAIDPSKFDFVLKNPFSDEQKRLYEYTFSPACNLKEQVDALCSL
ncbi:MAG: CDP-glycerol glycerophosphotransferase family protein [Parachlamydiales bacterium]|nr:CDP-glycerol glycerophosphotransferase family protein [Parachlamydiales bacterium]